MRAVWLATVANIDWPVGAGREWLARAIEGLSHAGCDTLFLQVRPAADAVHQSSLEPESVFVERGDAWDPLAEAISLAGEFGIAVHAWINPFRCRHAAHAGRPWREPVGLRTFPAGDAVWLDPGDPAVRARLFEVVKDLCSRYALAGVHLDDYFYPYPVGSDWDDKETWREHGGGSTRAAWRRANVDQAVAAVSTAVRATRPGCLFSVSPFGVWRPGFPAGVEAQVDSVADLCADPVAWARAGQVDFLVPQLYWPLESEGQPFEKLAEWWVTESAVPVAAGCLASKHPLDETLAQLKAATRAGCAGASLFSARAVLNPDTGLAEALRATSWGAEL